MSKQEKKSPKEKCDSCFIEDPHFHVKLEGLPVLISLMEFDFLFSEDGSDPETKKSDISEAITKSVCFSDKQPSMKKHHDNKDPTKRRSSIEWAKAFSNIKEDNKPLAPSLKNSNHWLKEMEKKTQNSKALSKPTTMIEYAFSDLRYPSQCFDLISRNELQTVERRVSVLEKEMEIIKQTVSTEMANTPEITKFCKELSKTSSVFATPSVRKFSEHTYLTMADCTSKKKNKGTMNTCYESSEQYRTIEFSLDSDSLMMFSRQSENIIEIMHSKVAGDKYSNSSDKLQVDKTDKKDGDHKRKRNKTITSIKKKKKKKVSSKSHSKTHKKSKTSNSSVSQKEPRKKLFWWTSTRPRDASKESKPTKTSQEPSNTPEKQNKHLQKEITDLEILKATEEASKHSRMSKLSDIRGKIKSEVSSLRGGRGWREVMHCLYTTNSAYRPSTESLRSASDPGPVTQKDLDQNKEPRQLKRKKKGPPG